MPGTWKLRKKRESLHGEGAKTSKNRDVYRSKSNKESKEVSHQVTARRRMATISGGAPAQIDSSESSDSIKSPDHYYTAGRSGRRRPALLQAMCAFSSNMEEPDVSSSPSNFIKIFFDDGETVFETAALVNEDITLVNLLESTCYERKRDLGDITNYAIISHDEVTGNSYHPDLYTPSTNHAGSRIEIRSQISSFQEDQISPLSKVMTVETCLDFFDSHGIVEIPCTNGRGYDIDTYHFPIVDKPIGPIESSWEELQIAEEAKKCLSSTEMSCQQAIWELIFTEHSFLKQLEIVINIYMRSLELIRRQDLLTEVNYHNIFGYMEEIYKAHEQFWTWTLQPCLEKVRIEHCPLDINDIILRFPTEFSQDFEVYEQHCAFETTNLNSLDEAMNHANFRAYVKWCESQPECNRLRLKDFLAIPRQRLMKYQLLFQAILKKTPQQSSSDELKQIIEDVSLFVDSVNGALKAQDETSRVQEVMKNIVGYAPVEIPGELKEFVQPHTHLDLMAPMPDVDVTKTRILVLEGKLRFRDQKDKMVVHVFLFSDMLLITKPVKRNVENYIVVRPPYKVSNIQVELRGDAVCCVVLNEFSVLSALFTLKAHSPDIAKEWSDQITSAQELYNLALTRTIPTLHILQSLRQERILNGVSQELFLDSPDTRIPNTVSPLLSTGSGLHRVNSNDSTLSSNSSLAFNFEGQAMSPRIGRRGTIPCHGYSETKKRFRRNSANPCQSPHSLTTSLSFTNTPIWQRTASLNALPERKGSDSSKSPRPHLKLRPSNSVCNDRIESIVQRSVSDPHRASSFNSLSQSKANKSTDFINSDCCPMLESAAPLQESDSNTDDEEYCSSMSPVNPTVTSSLPIWSQSEDSGAPPTIRRHRRNKSQPSNVYVIDTSTPDLSRHDERDDSLYTVPVSGSSVFGGERKAAPSPTDNDSLLSEINKELASRNESGSPKRHPHEADERYDSFDSNYKIQRQRSMSLHSNIGRLEKRFHSRRKAIQLDNIFETTDEDSDSNKEEMEVDATYFARNSKLRRSKSSFELSFHRRLKPPSPLITHMKRSFDKGSREDVNRKLKVNVSAPALPPLITHEKRDIVGDVNVKMVDGGCQEKGKAEAVQKKSPEKRKYGLSLFKRDSSVSPPDGGGSKWGFKGFRKMMAMSMETGLNHAGSSSSDASVTSPKASSSQSKKPARRNSPKIMIVLSSDRK